MRSFVYELGLALALVAITSARIAVVQERDLSVQQEGSFLELVQRFVKVPKHQKRQTQHCLDDDIHTLMDQYGGVSRACSAYLSTQTVTVDYTPTSTVIVITSTQIRTVSSTVRTTPYSTVVVSTTTTVNGNQKRDAQITEPASLEDRDLAFMDFVKRQGSTNGTAASDDAAISSSISSACACLSLPSPQVTETYTDQAETVTKSGYDVVSTTVVSTRTAQTVITTIYAVATVTGDPADAVDTTTAAAASASSVDTGSVLPSIAADSTVSVSVVTPGPIVVSGREGQPGTGSFYTSDGTVFSTNSAFTTYVSADGAWNSSWASAWSAGSSNAEAGGSGSSSGAGSAGAAEGAGADGSNSTTSVSSSDGSASGAAGAAGAGGSGALSNATTTTTTTSTNTTSVTTSSNEQVIFVNTTTISIVTQTVSNVTTTMQYFFSNGTTSTSTSSYTTTTTSETSGGAGGASMGNGTDIIVINGTMSMSDFNSTSGGAAGGAAGGGGGSTPIFLNVTTVLSSTIPGPTLSSSNLTESSNSSSGGAAGGAYGGSTGAIASPTNGTTGYSFSNTDRPRSGTYETSSTPIYTGTGYPSSIPFENTTSIPVGTGPHYASVTPTGNITYSPGPTGSFSPSHTGLPRSGTASTTHTRNSTLPHGTGTPYTKNGTTTSIPTLPSTVAVYGTSPFVYNSSSVFPGPTGTPSLNTTCSVVTVGTMTVTTTETVYACGPSCGPTGGYGGYGPYGSYDTEG